MARKWDAEPSQRLTLCVVVGQESAEQPGAELIGSAPAPILTIAR